MLHNETWRRNSLTVNNDGAEFLSKLGNPARRLIPHHEALRRDLLRTVNSLHVIKSGIEIPSCLESVRREVYTAP